MISPHPKVLQVKNQIENFTFPKSLIFFRSPSFASTYSLNLSHFTTTAPWSPTRYPPPFTGSINVSVSPTCYPPPFTGSINVSVFPTRYLPPFKYSINCYTLYGLYITNSHRSNFATAFYSSAERGGLSQLNQL
jgi:hypothetical protein